MASTAGDHLCERLAACGVTTLYGFPGDGINRILGALRRHEGRLRFVQTRHEEIAENSALDATQRAWTAPNLFVADGSVCPTQGPAGPAQPVSTRGSR